MICYIQQKDTLFCHQLSQSHIILCPAGPNPLFHANALVVIAVSIANAVITLLYLAHLVESRVGDSLRCGRKHSFCRCGGIQGMGLGGGAIYGVGEHGLPVGGLGRQAAIAVVGRRTCRRRPKPHLRQAILAIVTESFH